MTVDNADYLVDIFFEDILEALDNSVISVGQVKDSFDEALKMVLEELSIDDDSN